MSIAQRRLQHLRNTVAAIGLACLAHIAGPAPALSADLVRVGLVGTVSDVGIYLARKHGFYKAEGIELEITEFNTAARMIAPLGNGQLDVGGGAIAAGLYNANARKVGILIVADKGANRPGYRFGSIMVRKDLIQSGRYKTLADLNGMKVAIAAPGTGNAATVWEALTMAGLKWGDVETVSLGFSQHVVAFANKAIDASSTAEPLATLAVRQGVAVRVPNDADIYPYHQTSALLYSSPFTRGKPEVALRFMRAYIKGVRLYNDALADGRIAGPGADDVIATMIAYSEVKDPALLRETSPNACDPDGALHLESLAKDLSFFKQQGWIESAGITLDSVIDQSFAERVVADLGRYRPPAGR